MAIDRSKFVENVLKNGSRVLDGFIPYDLSKSPDGLDFREINGLYFPADPAQALKEARESLAKAKEELQTESISPAFSYNNTYPSDEIFQFIQSQWKRLDGGQIVMQGEESLAQSEHLSHHEFDLALAAASPDYADPITFLFAKTTKQIALDQNYAGWSNAKFDQLVEEASKEGDEALRCNKLLEAKRILPGEAPVCTLFQAGGTALKNPDLQGMQTSPVGAAFLFKPLEWKEE